MPYNRKAFSEDYATETFYFPLSVQVEDEDSEDLYNVSSDSATITSPTSKWRNISAMTTLTFSAS